MNLKLDIEPFTEEFFEDSRMIGITATLKNYKFCWLLNQTLGFNFRLNPNKEIQFIKKNRQYFFTVYEHISRNRFSQHYLYHNHSDGEYLLPEFKHMDFIWLMKGAVIEEEQWNGIIQSIKQLNNVQLVTELTNEQIKNKNYLIF